MTRVLITGSRSWVDARTITNALAIYGVGDTLVSGACPEGADAMAESAAAAFGMTLELHPAQWATYGRRAGFMRNAEMVALGADVCLAFIRDNSRGATHTAGLARAAGITVEAHYEWS